MGLATAVLACTAGVGWVAGRDTATLTALTFVGTGLCLAGAVVRPSPALVLGTAVLARALLLPMPPVLSDDAWRYLWDGRLQQEGINPYRYVPSDQALEPLRDATFERLNSPDYFSVYPPVSQLLFRAAVAGASSPERAWYLLKSFMVLLEVLGVVVLARVVPAGALALYAWHPLVVLEGAGQGHTETAMVGGLMVALAALARGYRASAGTALALAGWVKLVPFALVPVLRSRLGRRGMLACAATAVLLAAPFAAPYVLPHVASSLALYTGYFEWYAGPYLALKALGYALAPAPWEVVLGRGLLGVWVLVVFVLAVGSPSRSWSPSALLLAIYGGFLALATTVHPWYLLGPLAALPGLWAAGGLERRWVPVVLWVALWSVPTYLAYEGFGAAAALATWVGWGGGGVLAVWAVAPWGIDRLLRWRGRAKWRRLRAFVPPAGTVLDLGAGEGYVGAAAADEGHAVVLADVLDLNRTGLRHVVYDGRVLPFEDGRFEVIVLCHVLHHAEAPEQVLAEAARVSRSRVLILESVVETPWDRWWLPRADRWANRLRIEGGLPGGVRMRSAAAWVEACTQVGLRVARLELLGGPLHRQACIVALNPLLQDQSSSLPHLSRVPTATSTLPTSSCATRPSALPPLGRLCGAQEEEGGGPSGSTVGSSHHARSKDSGEADVSRSNQR